MPRGGKREGAGRKAQGITRKVSLTLTAEQWANIETSGQTVAAFLMQRVFQPPTAAERLAPEPASYARRYAEERWNIYLSMADSPHPPEAVESAKASFFRFLFPGGADAALVQTKTQYECPFTGKRYGSMDALVKVAIPHLLSSACRDLQFRREQLQREAAFKERKKDLI